MVCNYSFFSFFFFFFKQKTAYEMRISDWSSDVCSSDLHFVQRFSDIFGGTDHRVKIRQELGETEFVDRGCIAATGHDMFGRIVARPIFEYSFPIDYRQSLECLPGARKRCGRTGKERDRKSTRLNYSTYCDSRMPTCACKKNKK